MNFHLFVQYGLHYDLVQTHDRTGRLVANTAAVQDDSQVCHGADTLNAEDEILRKRTERSVADHDD